MKLKSTKQFVLSLVLLLVGASVFAQLRTPVDLAQEHVNNHLTSWGYNAQDMDGMTVSDQYTDPSTGISRVFFIQRHAGIPVHNAIQNLTISKNGKIAHVGQRFVQNLSEKVNTTVPVLNAEAAIVKLIEHLALPYEPIRLIGQNETGEFIFDKGNIAQENIKAHLSYQPYGSAVLLAWDITLIPVKSDDMWSARVDAVVGDVLDKTNWTVYCKVDGKSFHRASHDCTNHQEVNKGNSKTWSTALAADGTYNVWPSPVESPLHGNRQLVIDPHDVSASPFGWHDTNGQTGPEFTITRGNNVHAYEDSGNTNGSSNNEPDGGASLVFDFPFDPSLEPGQYTDAAVVNLFYWNNVMHDFSYAYGFNEASGNFQTNNYGNGGAGNDHVKAEAQDGSGTNNANFSTPADGSSGRMQMFLWGASSGEIFNVLEPASVAGPYPSNQPATGWGAGAYASQTGVSGEVAIVQDAQQNPYFTDGCDSLSNGSELQGKIALIDRGGCEFGWKAYNAQSKGAIAVIICNFEDANVSMQPGPWGDDVNIPTIFITSVVCQTIRQFAGSGLVVSIKIPDVPTGPSQLDGDLDNGIVAHEFGHGISTRLTGGPSQSGCLSNAEQMGEGWSDWFSLVTTVEVGDTGADKRGIGTYALGEQTTGLGIRRYPYSSDMAINPLTYGDVAVSTEVHDVGEVWCAMIWDLYWAFVDQYGWDPDLYHGTGGNNMAIRLVHEGMKNQPCSPGFLDGRDAIIAADALLNGGVNKCLIWKTFARRGAGLSADQGSSLSATDQTEAFDEPCECRDELTITKSVTDFINAGDDIDITISISNCKLETRTNVVVVDQIPDGTNFKVGSSNVPASVSGNSVSFEIGDIGFEENVNITYKLTTSPDNYSVRYYLDDVPNDDIDQNWIYYYDTNAPDLNIFTIQDNYYNSPDYAVYVPNIETESRTALELINPLSLTGARPTLRIYHRYDTESGNDAGLIEVKTGSEWQQVGNKMLRNGYPTPVAYGTFITPNLLGWSGSTNGEFVDTYIDLSDWSGEDMLFRLRFGTNDGAAGALGWVVDDFELMDLLTYNGEVCVTTDQGDNECAIAPVEGTIVESKMPSDIEETLDDISLGVFPNPAKDLLSVALSTAEQKDVNLSLVGVDGRVFMTRSMNLQGDHQLQINVAPLPSGFYFVKIETNEGVIVKKVVID